MQYEPNVLILRGVIERETSPGPPNYESIAKGDARETYWILRLDQARCMGPSPSEFYLKVHGKIRTIQLVFDSDDQPYVKYKSLVGKRVDATGQLFGAHTGHHHTEVLLTVMALEPARAK